MITGASTVPNAIPETINPLVPEEISGLGQMPKVVVPHDYIARPRLLGLAWDSSAHGPRLPEAVRLLRMT